MDTTHLTGAFARTMEKLFSLLFSPSRSHISINIFTLTSWLLDLIRKWLVPVIPCSETINKNKSGCSNTERIHFHTSDVVWKLKFYQKIVASGFRNVWVTLTLTTDLFSSLCVLFHCNDPPLLAARDGQMCWLNGRVCFPKILFSHAWYNRQLGNASRRGKCVVRHWSHSKNLGEVRARDPHDSRAGVFAHTRIFHNCDASSSTDSRFVVALVVVVVTDLTPSTSPHSRYEIDHVRFTLAL